MATVVCHPDVRETEERKLGPPVDLTVDLMLTETRIQKRPKLPKLDDFKKAIPKHCFKRDLNTSLYFLAKDYFALTVLYVTVPYFEYYGGLFGLFVWYVLMGIFGTALFLIGHDCMHFSFSSNEWINDLCGHLSMCPVLTPFYSWQISHKTHHAFTNHVDRDHGHPWITKHNFFSRPMILNYMNAFPLAGFFKWHHVYLIVGQPDGCHFWPFSKLHRTVKDQFKCVFSSTTVFLFAWMMFKMCGSDWFIFFKYFIVPQSFFGCLITLATYLNHIDEKSEAYNSDEWSWIRAQTQTIDRTYGFGLDYLLHHVSNGHFAHHMFNKIPHYHLLEATEGIKKVLEPFKDTQYGYKHQSTRDWFFRYIEHNIRLDYMVPKARGIWQFRANAEKCL